MSADSAHMAQLLAALDAADKAHDAAVQSGDSAKAAQIAQEASQLGALINQTPTTNVVPPTMPGNTSGSPPPAATKTPYSALSSGQDTLQVGPWDTGVKLPASTANMMAGMGKAYHDIGQGIGEKFGLSTPQDVHDSRQTDRELMSSPMGRAGEIAGNLTAFAPAAMIPGAQGVAAGALTGAGLGAMQPNEGSIGEQAKDTAYGALAGPLAHTLPEAGRLVSKIPGASQVGNFVSSIMPGGSGRTAQRILTDAASDGQNDASLARLRLEQAGKSGALADKYGISPTTAQVAQSPGIASLDRTVRTLPQGAAFPARDAANTGAVDDILRGISGTPAERLRASAARDFQARTMYDDALNNPEHFVQPPVKACPSEQESLS